MSVASRLRKQRKKSNGWLVVSGIAGGIVLLVGALAGGTLLAVRSVPEPGNNRVFASAIRGSVNVPEREIVMRDWYHAKRKEDFGEIIRWSRPYRYPHGTSIKFRFRASNAFNSITTYNAWIENGKLHSIRTMHRLETGKIQWAEPGKENVPADLD